MTEQQKIAAKQQSWGATRDTETSVNPLNIPFATGTQSGVTFVTASAFTGNIYVPSKKAEAKNTFTVAELLADPQFKAQKYVGDKVLEFADGQYTQSYCFLQVGQTVYAVNTTALTRGQVISATESYNPQGKLVYSAPQTSTPLYPNNAALEVALKAGNLPTFKVETGLLRKATGEPVVSAKGKNLIMNYAVL
jgi:hypothetical protein